jgi:hypothetical protein
MVEGLMIASSSCNRCNEEMPQKTVESISLSLRK